MEELTPPGAPRYEQLADRLRKRIFDGTWPEEDASGPFFGREYSVSQPIVQRAFEALEREGLVRLESGRRTTVLPRRRWRVEFAALTPEGDDGTAVAGVNERLARAQQPPGISGAFVAGAAPAMVLWVTAESADPFGAISLASPFGKMILGPLSIEAVSARPA